MAKLPETRITEACIAWLKKNGGDGWHVHGSSLQRQGEPDICGEFPTPSGVWLHLKIEVKTPTGVLSKLQEVRLDKYGKRGYIVGVVTSVNELREIIHNASTIRCSTSG